MANFPASLDNGVSLPDPTTSSTTNSPSHAGLHAAENAAIKAVETKLGTGSSTPAASTLLMGTGAGTSAWSALTSSQLAASISDATGTGSAVFANTPTLITPKIDTINENTVGNGVTVGGVNMKSGVVSTASAVPANALAANAVIPSKLGLSSGFTGGVTSQANSGSAGGTMWYINMGGLKMLWGLTGSLTATGSTPSSSSYVINWPSSFFTTIQYATLSASPGSASSSQYIYAAPNVAVTITAWNFYISESSGASATTSQASFMVIGT